MVQECIDIRGICHPPPPKNGRRLSPDDLSPAEIRTTNLAGRPLLHEHDSGERIGTCTASWEGEDGSLRMAARVTDPDAIRSVRNGSLRGLSLGTNLLYDVDTGETYDRRVTECSAVREGRRDGTWMYSVNNKIVHGTSQASKGASGLSSACAHISRYRDKRCEVELGRGTTTTCVHAPCPPTLLPQRPTAMRSCRS